jgi:hypothetical protein
MGRAAAAHSMNPPCTLISLFASYPAATIIPAALVDRAPDLQPTAIAALLSGKAASTCGEGQGWEGQHARQGCGGRGEDKHIPHV